MVDFGQRFQLFGRKCLVLHQHFHAVDADGKRSLQLMGSISRKFALLLVEPLVALHCAHSHLVQPAEFRNLCRVVERTVLLPYPIVVEPFQEHIQRTHAAIEHKRVDCYHGNDQTTEQNDNPVENGFADILFFKSRSGNRQFEIPVLHVFEYRVAQSCRLRFVEPHDEHLLIGIADLRLRQRLDSQYFFEIILVVRSVADSRQFLTAQRLYHNLLGIVVELVINLIVHHPHYGKIEQHSPRRQDKYHGE